MVMIVSIPIELYNRTLDDVHCRYQKMNGTNELREWYGDYINVEDQDYRAVTVDIF